VMENVYWIPNIKVNRLCGEIIGKDFPTFYKAPKGHPNKEGHKKIADWLIDNI